MHEAVRNWLSEVKERFPWLFTDANVLECGSYDINGTPRDFFEGCNYIGIDWRAGPGVDIVTLVHEFKPSVKFDTIISTEMLEHDPYWIRSLRQMVHLLEVNGSLILTFAGPTRQEHETDCAPGGYYHNHTVIDMLAVVTPMASFRRIEAVMEGTDVYVLFMGRIG